MNPAGAKQHLGVNGSGVRIDVVGRPRTKGSLVPIHTKMGAGKCRVSLTESGEYAVPWKKTMIAAIREQCVVSRFEGPVIIDCFFRFERLCVPDSSLLWPTREQGTYAHGDEDKLRRNALDALVQSGLIRDDSQSVGRYNFKRWVRDSDESCGVLLRVRPAVDADLQEIMAFEKASLW